MVKDADDTFDNVIDVSEVAAVFAVIKNLDRLARQYGFGELEQSHVWPPPRAINSEKAQSGGW